MYRSSMLLLVGILTLLISFSSTQAGVTVEPFGSAILFGANDQDFGRITLSADGDQPLSFEIEVDLVDFIPAEGVPRRDDRGDAIEDKSFELEEGDSCYKSLAWDYDNDLLIVSSYTRGTISAYDPYNGELISQIDDLPYCMEVAYLGGVIYSPAWGDSTIYRVAFDENGELENLGDIYFNGDCYAIAADYENDWLIVQAIVDQAEEIQFWTVSDENDFDQMIGAVEYYDPFGNFMPKNLEFVPEHRDVGPLWIVNNENLYQGMIDTEDWELSPPEDDDLAEPIPVEFTTNYEGVAHDGEDIWVSGFYQNSVQAYDDGVIERRWIIIEPEEGTIDADDEESLFVTMDFGNAPAGTYTYEIIINTSDNDVLFSWIFHKEVPAKLIYGEVFSSLHEQDIEGAQISLNDYYLKRTTAENGIFRIGYLVPGDYSIEVTHPEFTTQTKEFTVSEDDDAIRLEIDMLQAECNIEGGDRYYSIRPDSTFEEEVVISNGGESTLEYSVTYHLEHLDDYQPIGIIDRLGIEGMQEELGAISAIYADDQIYVATEMQHLFYVVNLDGSISTSFEMPNPAGNGFRDMTLGRDVMWGSDEDSVYALDFEGDLVTSFASPIDSTDATLCMAWDNKGGLLWTCNENGVFYGINPANGLVVRHFVCNTDSKISALGIYPYDQDDHFFYCYGLNNQSHKYEFFKADSTSGNWILVQNNVDSRLSRGLQITSEYDPYRWTGLTVPTNSDSIIFYHIDARTEWMRLNLKEGSLNTGESETLELTISSVGLEESTFSGLLRFNHNGLGMHSDLPVELWVSLGVPESDSSPSELSILSTYPNPFNSSLTVEYSLTNTGEVSVSLFDLTGRMVEQVFRGNAEAGVHFANVDGAAFASGVYLLRVESAGQISQRKIALIK